MLAHDMSAAAEPYPSHEQAEPPIIRYAFMQELLSEYQQRAAQEWTEIELVDLLEEGLSLCFWPFVSYLCELHTQGVFGGDVKDKDKGADREKILEMGAYAAFQQGDLSQAQSWTRTGLLRNQNATYLLQLSDHIEQWIQAIHQYPLNFVENKKGLYIQLMGHHHLDSFMSIYDPHTAMLCCLPDFVDDMDWHSWLEDQQGSDDQTTYAVMHPDYGMIGSVSLVIKGRTGFFYYWIGAEFRGQSFGPQSVQLLLEAASEVHGLENCYAKAFEENQASRSGLIKLGFKELPIRAAAPYESEVFYFLGLLQDVDKATEDMYRFYDQIRCWKPFTRPLCASARKVRVG